MQILPMMVTIRQIMTAVNLLMTVHYRKIQIKKGDASKKDNTAKKDNASNKDNTAKKDNASRKDNAAKTGDSTPIVWLFILPTLSGTGVFLIKNKDKKNVKH